MAAAALKRFLSQNPGEAGDAEARKPGVWALLGARTCVLLQDYAEA